MAEKCRETDRCQYIGWCGQIVSQQQRNQTFQRIPRQGQRGGLFAAQTQDIGCPGVFRALLTRIGQS